MLESLGFKVYEKSINQYKDSTVLMARRDDEDYIVVVGDSLGFEGKTVEKDGKHILEAKKTHGNAQLLRKLFPFTAPARGLGKEISMGLGDRLGEATDGHIMLMQKYPKVFPVFAQQSIRELKLTHRDYVDVLDVVTFSTFKNGYKSGYGADGDHLKTPEEIQYAIDSGVSMITLDLSEKIHQEPMSEPVQNHLEAYIGKSVSLSCGHTIDITKEDTLETSMIYHDALLYIEEVYKRFIENKNLDFEISMDETATPTKPVQHYIIASELKKLGIEFQSLALRFIGEFQKGIDYIGDIKRFEQELIIHQAIADEFDYKLSIHSGSDKFSVFPIIGDVTKQRFHIKTAGTNWLEAVLLVAIKEPKFYREMHAFALDAFEKARAYYVVTTDLSKIPSLNELSDEQLPDLLKNNDARQLLHITYGEILSAKDEQSQPIFHDRFYKILNKYHDDYSKLLENHIGRHLSALLGE
ncbi:MAG: tagaturonate epimerase family protein [Eubacteriales bacterium]|nr:tagaturonate epimerase family protein [Eubacteriales bacterium]